MSEELKPCPFCGSAASEIKYLKRYQIACLSDGCLMRPRTDWLGRDGAIESWGIRGGELPRRPSPPSAEIAGAEKAVIEAAKVALGVMDSAEECLAGHDDADCLSVRGNMVEAEARLSTALSRLAELRKER